jgi:citrate synthase
MKKARDINDDEKDSLLSELIQAHYKAASNNSISKMVFQATFEGSGNVVNAISAGLLTIGDKHGPLYQARALVKAYEEDPENARNFMFSLLKEGEKIPGFGNSFFKTGIDPAFYDVYRHYAEVFLRVHETYPSQNTVYELWEVFYNLKSLDLPRNGFAGIYPNAAIITGAIMELCGCVPFYENWIFINGRTRAWIESLSS